MITGCCDGGVTSGGVCGLGFAMGVIAGVVVVLGRCTAVGGLSRNVFLVGGCACPTMPHYAPLCIHWLRLACGLIGAWVSVEAGGGTCRGGLAANFAGAMWLRGEEA